MESLIVRALHQIRRDIPGLGIETLEFVERGPVFLVFRGVMANGRHAGVRVVPEHWLATENDDGFEAIDPGEIIAQEARISTHCRAHGVPAPEVFGRSRHADEQVPGLDLLVYEWLEGDGGEAAPSAQGETLSAIHTLNPPAFEPVRQRGRSFERAVAAQIFDAAASIARRTGQPVTMPDPETLRVHLGWPDRRTSLLHMDFVPKNLHGRGGRILGVMGWCEALIGPPTYELMALDERGLLNDAFLGGYSNFDMFHAPEATEAAFRLATAAPLAARALAGVGQDADGVARALSRARHLFDRYFRLSS